MTSAHEAGEVARSFEVFGSHARILVGVPRSPACAAPEVAAWALEQRFADLHRALTRFDPESELARLNRDPRVTVGISRDMASFLGAAKEAARRSEGLVDATRLDGLEDCGYRGSRAGAEPADLAGALAWAPQRRPAAARTPSPWHGVSVDPVRRTVTRPPGVRFDSGGIVKGLAADLGAAALSNYSSFAVDCGGDLRIGGADGLARSVDVADPFAARPPARFAISSGAVATTGINRRIWPDGDGFAHHLIDPATDAPAWTGLVQATAVGPTAVVAETLAKAALLSGPEGAERWLSRWGGVTYTDDGRSCAFGPLRAELGAGQVAA